MGAYVSKPVTDKTSFDGENEFLSYGASSMQGWRASQEDAHNAIIDFDKSTSFFAVYDGHGGHEVAEYTAQKLPEFIKESDCYKSGDLSQALIDSFLEFDKSLVTPEILNILKEISGTKDTASPDSDKEEVDHLCREASMPLEQVIAKYSEGGGKFQSPFLKSKKIKVGCSSSSMEAGCSSSGCGSSSSPAFVIDKFALSDSDDEDAGDEEGSRRGEPDESDVSKKDSPEKPSKTESSMDLKSETDEAPASSSVTKLCNGNASEAHPNNVPGELPSTAICDNDKDHKKKAAENETCDYSCDDKESKVISPISSTDIKKVDKVKEVSDLTETTTPSDAVNGETNGNLADSCTYSDKGGVKGLHCKGKKFPAKVSCANKIVSRKPKRLAASRAEEIYRQIQEGADIDDSNSDLDEEEDDEDIEGGLHNEDCEDEVDDSDELDDEEDSSEEEEDDSNDDLECGDEDECLYTENQMSMTEEPGFDSGCTACVTLLRGSDMYVANVGDSRCVVCRDGEAIDMSLDHKPEDEPESSRITKAGGKVTDDGRVNGGLNLSRALGDHSYKQNKSLSAEEQMISPLPDIKNLSLQPKDRFMILACDGIWNSMTSQEACDFVSKRLDNGDKLPSICEQLFDYCLAPNIEGDGAGCDNMTCIIVAFSHKADGEGPKSTAVAAVAKRSFKEVSAEDNQTADATSGAQEKKIKLDGEAS